MGVGEGRFIIIIILSVYFYLAFLFVWLFIFVHEFTVLIFFCVVDIKNCLADDGNNGKDEDIYTNV